MRFNAASPGTKTTNVAGGAAYTLDARQALTTLVLTSFLKDQFYRTASDTLTEIAALLKQVPAEYAMKLAVFARKEYGMRSITHVVAGMGLTLWRGNPLLKKFLKAVIYRPDDMLEILAFYNQGRTKFYIPNSLKKVMREKLADMNEYTLAKYRGEGKEIKMVDLVNLVHPKNSAAIKKLVKGELVSTDTWESRLTQAGQKAKEDGEDLGALKSDAWLGLLKEKKLGYFALLRNCRNIIQGCPEGIPMLCEQLVDEAAIKKSLVLPFRYYTACKAIMESKESAVKPVLAAIEKAMDIACGNIPKLSGKTLVCMDESGSMKSASVDVFASVFTGILHNLGDTDIITFAERSRLRTFFPSDGVMRVTNTLLSDFNAGGTNFNSVFSVLRDSGYSRIIFLSDMQGWMERTAPLQELRMWCKPGNTPWIHSIDLAGYGTTKFPADRICLLAGMSEKVLEMIPLLEEDRSALVKKIDGAML